MTGKPTWSPEASTGTATGRRKAEKLVKPCTVRLERVKGKEKSVRAKPPTLGAEKVKCLPDLKNIWALGPNKKERRRVRRYQRYQWLLTSS